MYLLKNFLSRIPFPFSRNLAQSESGGMVAGESLMHQAHLLIGAAGPS